MANMNCSLFCWSFFSALILYTCQAQSCGGISTLGSTYPIGDIFVLVGDTYEVFCTVNISEPQTEGRNSTYLMFYEGSQKVSEPLVSIVNETTIKLRVENATVALSGTKYPYFCKLETKEGIKGVCVNYVYVGYPPTKVDNFSCISQNWESLKCTWDAPPNPIPTIYDLYYSVPVGNRNASCPFYLPERNEIDELGGTKLAQAGHYSRKGCFFGSSTKPSFYNIQNREWVRFKLVSQLLSQNLSLTQNFQIHNFAFVIPGPMQSFTLAKGGAYSAQVNWQVSSELQAFPPGLVYRVKYQALPSWGIQPWVEVNTSMLVRNTYPQILDIPLPYANVVYNITLEAKSAAAGPEEYLWSQPNLLVYRSDTDLPCSCPATTVGSFVADSGKSSRNVYVYWSKLDPWCENDNNGLTYNLTAAKGDGSYLSVEPVEVTPAYAKYVNLDIDAVDFSIQALNSVGFSRNSSVVHVPKLKDTLKPPRAITKIDRSEGNYTLVWKGPVSEEITSYTVFYCENSLDRPYDCKGKLSWVITQPDVSQINITVPNPKSIYQFAVSANNGNMSSGMAWATCTKLVNNRLDKIRDVSVTVVTATSITLTWRLDCSNPESLIDAFVVNYYCNGSLCSGGCTGQKKNVTVPDTENMVTLTNLDPFTSYMVTLSALTEGELNEPSDPLYNITSQAAPSPPMSLEAKNVTNDSIFVTWASPDHCNGILTNYRVILQDSKTGLQDSQDILPNLTQVTLEDLKSYHNYTVVVKACTAYQMCSANSLPLNVRTDIGVPSIPGQPITRMWNYSTVFVTWDAPVETGGPSPYYNLEILVYDESGNETNSLTQKVEAASNRSVFVEVNECSSSEAQFGFRVQAINLDSKGEEYLSPWSVESKENCVMPGLTMGTIIWIVTSICVAAVVFAMVFFGVRWTTRKYKETDNIDPSLPWEANDPNMNSGMPITDDKYPRIELNLVGFEKEQFSTRPFYGRLISPASNDNKSFVLRNKDPIIKSSIKALEDKSPMNPDVKSGTKIENQPERHGRNQSGDSSGFSSGHASISSSHTSRTHLSSDSGTDVVEPPSPGQDNVFTGKPWLGLKLKDTKATEIPNLNVSAVNPHFEQHVYAKLDLMISPTPNYGVAGGDAAMMKSSPDMLSSDYSQVAMMPEAQPKAATTGYVVLPVRSHPDAVPSPSLSTESGSSRNSRHSECSSGTELLHPGYTTLQWKQELDKDENDDDELPLDSTYLPKPPPGKKFTSKPRRKEDRSKLGYVTFNPTESYSSVVQPYVKVGDFGNMQDSDAKLHYVTVGCVRESPKTKPKITQPSKSCNGYVTVGEVQAQNSVAQAPSTAASPGYVVLDSVNVETSGPGRPNEENV